MGVSLRERAGAGPQRQKKVFFYKIFLVFENFSETVIFFVETQLLLRTVATICGVTKEDIVFLQLTEQILCS
jgi:hypothetical protein